MMKTIMTAMTALVIMSGAAFATETGPCKKNGDHWKCDIGGSTFNVSNVNNAGDAEAAALAYANANGGNASATGGAGGQGGQGGQGGNSDQEQSQGQGQSQTSENNNSAYNGGNSVNFEGDPAHTTSLNANVGLNVTLPIGAGIQAASCRDTVRLAREMGQETLALQILLECPHVRKLNLKVNPGDKG